MSISQNFPTIKPSLNLSFALTKALDPRVTFARASTGTFYDGVTTAKAEENLLVRSQEFNIGWLANNFTLASNTTVAPDGTTTASTLTATATSNVAIGSPAVSATSGTYVVSIYVEKNKNFTLAFNGVSSGIGINVDGTAGTFVSNTAVGSGYTVDSYSIVSVGNYWRASVVCTTTDAGNKYLTCAINNSSGTTWRTGWDAVIGDTLVIWGAQLEQRDTVTAYTPTTTQPITNYIPVLQTASANVARFDHNPVTGESLGLLVEEQRTNLVLYSQEFDNAYWSKTNVTVTANTVVAPDGTLSGDLVIPTSTSGLHIVSRAISANGSTGTVYAKASGYSWLVFGGFGGRVYFDLSSGTVGSISSPLTSPSIEPVGNGWYKCSVNFGVQGNVGFNIFVANADQGAGGTPASFSGDGYSGIYIWGVQLEAGSFPTSYISTSASQVTRSADSASMTGTNFSSWYRQDEGTVYAEAESSRVVTNLTGQFALSDNTNANRIESYASAANHLFVSARGVLQADLDAGAFTANVFSKLAASYKFNDMAVVLNSGTVVTDTSAIVPVVNRLYIGANHNGGAQLNGHIRKLSYYNQRLTNEQLVALTS